MTTPAGSGHLDQNERCFQENPAEATTSTLHLGNQARLTSLKRGQEKTLTGRLPSHIAIGGLWGELEIWRLQAAVRVRRWRLVEKLNELSFSPDGEFLAVAERSGAIHIVEWKNADKPVINENLHA
ncbi:hypothetical protein [Schlesneria sp. T3-172]|uniref:hypothetical protein n=1 Tax=Schlesneria sphaerica TaxID=3373610 RepID=UPI0037C8EB8D